jgi:hypothetical protein
MQTLKAVHQLFYHRFGFESMADAAYRYDANTVRKITFTFEH